MPAPRSDPRPTPAANMGPRTVARELVTHALPSAGSEFPAADRQRLFRALALALDVFYGPVPDSPEGYSAEDVALLARSVG